MRWVYNRFAKPKIVVQKVDDGTIPNRLELLINNPVITPNDKQFCESLKHGWNNYKSLTAGQYGALQKCELRYDATNIANRTQAQNDWLTNFTPEMRARMNVCAQYYINTPYFRDIATRVLADSTWVPSEKQYHAMCENKYANRIMENIETPAKYNVGDVVEVRKTVRWWSDSRICAILACEATVGPSRGSRKYTVIPFGSDQKVDVNEKDIKKYRPKKDGETSNGGCGEDVPF